MTLQRIGGATTRFASLTIYNLTNTLYYKMSKAETMHRCTNMEHF